MGHRWRDGVRALVLLALGCSSLSGTARAEQMILRIHDEGHFEVLDSRADSTATGAVIFGLIGYAIEEGSRNSKDKEKEDAIFVEIPPDVCKSYMLEAFQERLQEKGFDVTVQAAREKVPDNARLMNLKISNCGFRKVNSETDELSPYFKARYNIRAPQGEKSVDYENLSITGKSRMVWDEVSQDIEGATREFRALKAKAGRRLANKLIYSRD